MATRRIPKRASISEDDELNRAAVRAALGWRADWATDLTALLRSDEPIHWMVREALADAIDGDSGFGAALKMTGHAKIRNAFDKHELNRRNMEIGRWIQYRLDDGIYKTQGEAADYASSHFNTHEKTCEAAIQYFRKTNAWIRQVRELGQHYNDWSDADLEDRYHGFDAFYKKRPPLTPGGDD